MNHSHPDILRSLPAVHELLAHELIRPLVDACGRGTVVEWIRAELQQAREAATRGECGGDRDVLLRDIATRVAATAQLGNRSALGRVVNATGVILHTGLGRAQLSQRARRALDAVAGAANVEFDLDTGERRERGFQLQSAWRTLTNAEDSLVVNNNAAATLLTLQVLCGGKEVVISRGQLIEIGGSFRLPEIFELSGAKLREVGTTNCTRAADYAGAITGNTAALMRVHPSNYRIVGFTETPDTKELAALAREHGLLMLDDIGSGCLVDVSRYGLPAEPTFQQSLSAGADVVLGSGDKLLGGPQAGVILGRSAIISQLRRHPLARTLRVDKLSLAALAATLDAYLQGKAETELPTLSLLSASVTQLAERAAALQRQLADVSCLKIDVARDQAPVGGGSLPGAELPTAVLRVRHRELASGELARRLRLGEVQIVPRIQADQVVIDLRSVLPEDDARIAQALRTAGD